MNLTAWDFFVIALGVCVAALIGWLIARDDDA